MIKVFYGDNRVAAHQEIAHLLGQGYEVIDAPELTPGDLPSVFFGASLFATSRRLLIRDFFANKSIAEQLSNYLTTPHEVIIFETKLDKRSAAYKAVKDTIEFREFKLPEDPRAKQVFDIFRVARRDGPSAVRMLEEIKLTSDPNMFVGLLTSQAIRDFRARQGTREKRVLKELSSLDLSIKTTKVDPWLQISSFLLRLP
jgi:hypothetical protein